MILCYIILYNIISYYIISYYEIILYYSSAARSSLTRFARQGDRMRDAAFSRVDSKMGTIEAAWPPVGERGSAPGGGRHSTIFFDPR